MPAHTLAACARLVAASTLLPASFAFSRPIAAQAPATDVFLADLTTRGGRLSVGPARNLTSHDGYDNQPSWSRDGKWIYFTTVRAGDDADIWKIDVASGIATRVTDTAPESEYSPTVMSDGSALSVVRVERDSSQRLWRFPLDGSAPSVILPDVKPVGYHAWADSVTVALFVLGSPNTLQLADVRTGRADTIITNVGRSLHPVPGGRRISFVHKVSREEWWLELLDPLTKQTQRLVRMPRGVEDYDWTSGGLVVAGQGSTLRAFDPKRGGGWTVVRDLQSSGLGGITRVAVSPAGDRLAIVAVPAKRP